jgi:hypothetical protein
MAMAGTGWVSPARLATPTRDTALEKAIVSQGKDASRRAIVPMGKGVRTKAIAAMREPDGTDTKTASRKTAAGEREVPRPIMGGDAVRYRWRG